jgi:hypothetical protein
MQRYGTRTSHLRSDSYRVNDRPGIAIRNFLPATMIQRPDRRPRRTAAIACPDHRPACPRSTPLLPAFRLPRRPNLPGLPTGPPCRLAMPRADPELPRDATRPDHRPRGALGRRLPGSVPRRTRVWDDAVRVFLADDSRGLPRWAFIPPSRRPRLSCARAKTSR